MTSISFPNISDYVFQLSKTLPISFFGIEIAWYGFIIGMAIVVAATYGFTQCNRFGFSRSMVLEYLFYGIPSCYIGARIYYVVYEWEYYSQNLKEIFYVKNGGLAIYGAVLAGALSIVIFLRVKKGNILSALDLGAICLLIGQVMGRWGNFINGEAFGYGTDLPWGMSINGGELVHPTFLYESLWNFCLLLLMHFRSKKRIFKGEIMFWYIVGYGSGRAWIEGLRTDSLYIANTNIRASQLLAIVSAVVAGIIMIYFYISKKYLDFAVMNMNADSKPTAEVGNRDKHHVDSNGKKSGKSESSGKAGKSESAGKSEKSESSGKGGKSESEGKSGKSKKTGAAEISEKPDGAETSEETAGNTAKSQGMTDKAGKNSDKKNVQNHNRKKKKKQAN